MSLGHSSKEYRGSEIYGSIHLALMTTWKGQTFLSPVKRWSSGVLTAAQAPFIPHRLDYSERAAALAAHITSNYEQMCLWEGNVNSVFAGLLCLNALRLFVFNRRIKCGKSNYSFSKDKGHKKLGFVCSPFD